MSSVDIVINYPKKPFFTSYDVIKGTVDVVVKRDVTVSSIDVKLECIEQTALQRSHRTSYLADTRKEVKSAKEKHCLLYQSLQVFPTEDLSSTDSRKFTLAKGRYSYDFEFTLPQETSYPFQYKGSRIPVTRAGECMRTERLPPTFDMGREGSISYFVKVTVRKASMLKFNDRLISPFDFLPSETPVEARGPRPVSYERKPFVIRLPGNAKGFRQKLNRLIGASNDPMAELIAEARFQAPIRLYPSVAIPISLHLLTPTNARKYVVHLDRIITNLVGTSNLKAGPLYATRLQREHIDSREFYGEQLNFTHATRVGNLLSVDINYEIPGLRNPLMPSFASIAIEQSYTLEVALYFTVQNKSENVVLQLPVEIPGCKPATISSPVIVSPPGPPSPPARRTPPIYVNDSKTAVQEKGDEKASYNNTVDSEDQAGPSSSAGNDDLPPSYEES